MDYTKIDVYAEKLKEMLTESRFEHTVRTVNKAVELSEGTDADMEVVLISAFLHDCAKYTKPTPEQAEKIKDFIEYPQVVHAPLGAILANEIFGISDERILNAIKYHTTGRANMSIEEKIVFLADAIEDGRQYPAAEKIRNIAKISIDKAIIESLDGVVQFENSKGNKKVHHLTLEALEYLKKESL